MTRDVDFELAELIASGEGRTVEFRRSLTKDVGRTFCAFANAGGGTALLGVSDAGKVLGVADHNRLEARVLSTARSTDPPIGVGVESVGDVLRVVVPPQKRKPYSFGGRFFVRDGASSRQMSNAEIEELFYAAGRLHFDRKPCPDFSLDNDLDDETWARFSRRAKIPESNGSDGRVPEPRPAGQRRPDDARRGVAPGPRRPQVHDFRACVLRAVHGHREGAHPRPARLPWRRAGDGRSRRGVDPDERSTSSSSSGTCGGRDGPSCRKGRFARRSRTPWRIATTARPRTCRSTSSRTHRDRQPRRAAGGNEGGGSRRQEHAPESPAVRHAVPDGRGRKHRLWHQADPRPLPGARRGGAGHRGVRALGDGDVSETGTARQRTGCPRNR